VYKIPTGKEDMDPTCTFQFASLQLNLREHQLKLYKKSCRLNIRKYFFSQRTVMFVELITKSRGGSSFCQQFRETFG